jgi:L-fuconolactonase
MIQRRTFLAAAGAASLGATLGACATAPSSGHDIIDAHVHLFDPQAQSHPWLDGVPAIRKRTTTAEYRAAAVGAPVRKIVCIEAAPVLQQSLREAQWLRQQAAGDELVGAIVPQAAVERGGEVRRELEALLALGKVTGIRRILGAPFQTDPGVVTRASTIEGVRALAEYGLVFDLAGISPANLDAAIQLVKACPATQFILDHGGRAPIAAGQLQPWARQMKELGALPNASLKLSNLVRDAGPDWSAPKIRPFVDVAVEAFGFDRLLFGSDFPVVTIVPRGSIPGSVALMRELFAQVPEGEQRKYFHDNAARLYRVS